ncbi:T9SS type B sorting domain-containing protein [Flavobacterium sp. J27]|uniref:T9SS type B sorting domain-containing protein n=1 Tax=Flavobacterium sp. J27 TaxID=2060419 RepID=UPI001030B831|nr:choice-of-anchor L domain-containing protein [Flavobacterium sp. J27]
MKHILTFLGLLLSQSIVSQYITIDETYTAQQLIENVLINSGCASVSNVSVSGANFSTGELSYGYFNGSGTTFPFQNGIILSTGKVSDAPGPTTPTADNGSNMNWNGDSDLDQILNVSSTNATVLEFDFIPLGNRISFDYIFSSEEYEEDTNYPCQYSDGFAFLLKPVGASAYQNLALIPNTNTPVKVTTVHPLITANGGCPAQNEQYFDQFNPDVYPTVYNGQTVVLTAESTVVPGTPYHIKLVIADENDARFDSAIFLKGGSFNLGINLGDDRTIANNNAVCPTENLVLDATATGALTYQWFLNNNPITVPSADPLLNLPAPHDPATQNGIYSVEIVYNTTCSTTSEIKIDFAPELTINQDIFTLCDNDTNQDGITTFDLATMATQIFQNLPNGDSVFFYNSQTASTSLPLNYTNTTPFQQTIYARSNQFGNCYNIPITLNVNTFNEVALDQTQFLCSGSTIILDAGSGFASYSWNTTPVQNTQTITVTTGGTYLVTLENANGCFKTITIIVNESNIATIDQVIINDIADNNTATVNYTGLGDYVFSLNGFNYQESPVFQNLIAGEYTVFVKDKNGCGIASELFYILDYPKFFTPNGDGYNDTWQIKNLDKRGLENSKIYIFDRFGKLLKQINPIGNGWNGTFNGELLPSSDYWFVLELSNGKTVKSHFSMKR